jgi:hypothetical protein
MNGINWGTIELTKEVHEWLESLLDEERGHVFYHIDRLRQRGPLLGFPYTSQLSGKLRELRFTIRGGRTRITYYIAPGRKIVLLTVFTKTRQREAREVVRATKQMKKHQKRM